MFRRLVGFTPLVPPPAGRAPPAHGHGSLPTPAFPAAASDVARDFVAWARRLAA